MTATGATVGTPGVRRATKVAVLAFVGAFALAGLVGVEAWPVTGWRLYSHVRHGEQTVYRAFTVGPDGREAPLAAHDLPVAYHHVARLLARVAGEDAATKAGVCRGLLEGARRAGRHVDGVRVLETRVRFRVAGGHVVKERTREPAFECARQRGRP